MGASAVFTQVQSPALLRLSEFKSSDSRFQRLIVSTISLRDRRQLTLPAEVVAAVGLQVNDTLDVRVVDGVIHLVPVTAAARRTPSLRRFLGATPGLYGQDAEQADDYVRQQRES